MSRAIHSLHIFHLKQLQTMKEQHKLFILILIFAALFAAPSFLDAQPQQQETTIQSDTSEYQIEASYIIAELDTLEFHELISKFKKDFELSTPTLTAWFSNIATATELRTIEFTDENIEMMLVNRYVPFPVTQAAIRGHVYSYYLTKP